MPTTKRPTIAQLIRETAEHEVGKLRSVRLRTQRARSQFVLREMRAQRLTELDVAEAAGVGVLTVRRFIGVGLPASLRSQTTRYPYADTLVRIFGALGWSVTFTHTDGNRGTVVL